MPEDALALSREYPLTLLLGLLGSRLLSSYYYWKLTGEGVRIGGGFHTYPKTIRQLPIYNLRTSNDLHSNSTEQIARAAEWMLDLHKKLPAARTDQEKTTLQRQIADTDRRIDRLVYDLYGLTEDNIEIVEGVAVESSK